MVEDSELLRRYVEERSQAAFTQLVERRVNLVYAVALRQVGGDAHLAEDVTQKVFADLARKAASLTGRPVLSGWLYRSAQFAGTDVVRSERRRRAREQETHFMNETIGNDRSGSAEWEKLRPVLDQAMGELDDEDRDAVALRFFEERPFAEIGRALRLSEDTARKRVERALDKLHAALSRRGLASTSAALGLALANQVAGAAPAGLAASAAGAALATSGTAAAAGWSVLQVLGSTKVIIGAMGAAAVVGVSTVVYEVREANKADAAAVMAAVSAPEMAAAQTLPAEAQGTLPGGVGGGSVVSTGTAQTGGGVQPGSGGGGMTSTTRVVASGSFGTTTETKAIPFSARKTPSNDPVDLRYDRARELAKQGLKEESLKEFLWCFDEGMLTAARYSGVRLSFLLGDIAVLGKTYPPAIAALIERRDAAERKMLANAGDVDAPRVAGAINRELRDEARTLTMMDQFPLNDPRRNGLGKVAFDRLIELKRYDDAARAQPYAFMNQILEYYVKDHPEWVNRPDAERLRQNSRTTATNLSLKNVEVLAGVGDLPHAQAMMGTLLALDSSAGVKAALRARLQRAGHQELIDQ